MSMDQILRIEGCFEYGHLSAKDGVARLRDLTAVSVDGWYLSIVVVLSWVSFGKLAHEASESGHCQVGNFAGLAGKTFGYDLSAAGAGNLLVVGGKTLGYELSAAAGAGNLLVVGKRTFG